MCKITEAHLAAFNDEIQQIKTGSKWYSRAAESVARFGKRQLHSVSGWTPKGFNNLEGIKEIGADTFGHEHGLTNLPALARSLVKDPKGTVRAGLRQQWEGNGPLGKAITVGLPAATLAADAVSEDDGHKAERLGAGIAGTAAGLVTGGMPLAGGMIAGTAASMLGGRIGRAFDKKPKPVKASIASPPLRPEEMQGQHVPTERELSPSAAGRTEVF